MSAFEVSDTHIDVLVSAALQRRHGDTLTWYHGDIAGTRPGEALPSREDYLTALKAARREVNSENAETWGATLLAENRRSVNHRYDEDEIEAPYTFTEYAGHINPVAILSAISCYEYQACEHPGWKASEAHDFCEALRREMIRQLPGYGSAPWEITDPAQAFKDQPSKVWRPGQGKPRPGEGRARLTRERAPGREREQGQTIRRNRRDTP
jgi:hypothetical protein